MRLTPRPDPRAGAALVENRLLIGRLQCGYVVRNDHLYRWHDTKFKCAPIYRNKDGHLYYYESELKTLDVTSQAYKDVAPHVM